MPDDIRNEQGTAQNVQIENGTSQTVQQDEPVEKWDKNAYKKGIDKGKREFLKEIESYGITPDDFPLLAELKQKKEELETENLIKKQDYEALIKKTENKYSKMLEINQSKLKETQSALEKLGIDREVMLYAGKHEAYDPEEITALIRLKYNLSYDTKTLNPVIQDKDGNELINKETGAEMTIEDVILNLKATRPHLFKGRQVQGSGTQETEIKAGMQAKDLASILGRQIEKELRI